MSKPALRLLKSRARLESRARGSELSTIEVPEKIQQPQSNQNFIHQIQNKKQKNTNNQNTIKKPRGGGGVGAMVYDPYGLLRLRK